MPFSAPFTRFRLLLLLACLLSASAAWAGNARLFEHPRLAPQFQLMALDGQRINLNMLRGKVVLLNFWATWCGPCRMEIPELIRLQNQYAGRLQIVGMSVDTIPAVQVAAFTNHARMNYPVVIAPDQVQREYGGIPYTPTSVLIDGQGRIEQVLEGMRSYSEFNTDIRALIGLPFGGKIVRVHELSPHGKVSTLKIPGLQAALSKLTPAQRETALRQLNQTQCDCGCRWSLATCRVQDPHCGYSLPEALALIAKIKR